MLKTHGSIGFEVTSNELSDWIDEEDVDCWMLEPRMECNLIEKLKFRSEDVSKLLEISIELEISESEGEKLDGKVKEDSKSLADWTELIIELSWIMELLGGVS